MKLLSLVLTTFACLFLMGAGYVRAPADNNAISTGGASYGSYSMEERKPKRILETKVSPEEVYKYGVQEYSVIATKDGYFPAKIIVRRNIPVRIYLTTTESRDLCFVMEGDDYSIRRGIASQRMQKVSFMPRRVGPFKFHCPIHNIKGTMIVRD